MGEVRLAGQEQEHHVDINTDILDAESALYGRVTSVRFHKDLHHELKLWCKETGIGMGFFINQAVRTHLANKKRESAEKHERFVTTYQKSVREVKAAEREKIPAAMAKKRKAGRK